MAAELRACAAQEAEIQAALRAAGETVTEAEVAAQRLRDQAAEAELELASVTERLGACAERERRSRARRSRRSSLRRGPAQGAADAGRLEPLGEEQIASLKRAWNG